MVLHCVVLKQCSTQSRFEISALLSYSVSLFPRSFSILVNLSHLPSHLVHEHLCTSSLEHLGMVICSLGGGKSPGSLAGFSICVQECNILISTHTHFLPGYFLIVLPQRAYTFVLDEEIMGLIQILVMALSSCASALHRLKQAF